MEIIKDLRVLKAIGKRCNIKFDEEYKYCIDYNGTTTDKSDLWVNGFNYNNNKYILKFFDGCFHPYLVKI